MNEQLLSYVNRPEIYAKSTAKFWDDEHISGEMLKAHLDPNLEAASRKHKFMDESTLWIAGIAPAKRYPNLLDLGCGPGLYAQRFSKQGYLVTGIDFSRRSVDYARSTAAADSLKIEYLYQDYRTIAYHEEFDIITLIYCDFCVLSDSDRELLLRLIYQALKPGGIFLVDVTTPKQYENRPETASWSYQDNSFWCGEPHLCLNAFYRYEDNCTFLNQAVIVTKDCIRNIYIWDHTFTKEELERDLRGSGFGKINFYKDVAGASYDPEGVSICAVAVK